MIFTKKIIIYSLISFFILMCLRNYFSTTTQYLLSNISIREAFFGNNEGKFDANNDGILDFVKKGTHDGGQEYFDRIYNYIDLIKNLKFKELKNILNKTYKIKIEDTQFYTEYLLIEKLKEFSKLDKKERSKMAIYIPKSNKVFWNLSCDSLMIPFIVPAISNISGILSLPTLPWSDSCFGQIDGYGYGVYYKYFREEIPLSDLDYTDKALCIEAQKYLINKIIKLNIKKDDIIENEIICN